MIPILTSVLHLILFSQLTAAIGNLVCSPHHNEVNPRTIFSVINSIPTLSFTPVPGELENSTRFHVHHPPGGPWYFPAVFQSPTGDSVVSVSVVGTTLMNIHDNEDIASLVWAHARNLAITLYHECQMGTTGRGGRTLRGIGEAYQLEEHHTVIEVRVGKAVGLISEGDWHKSVSVYEVPSGGGTPVLRRPSSLIHH